MSKTILITGCSSGFGYDAALKLARKGHTVHATMRAVEGRNKPAADALLSAAAGEGISIHVHEMDVTSDESVNAALSGLGAVDVLINNAGLGYGGPVETFTSQEVLRQLDVNIVGTVRVAQAVLPGMRSRKSGLIIQVSSTAGRGAFPGFGVYHASKWGLEGLSEAMRYELSPFGVDVVLVEPGPFSTNFFANMVSGSREAVAAEYPHVAEFFSGFESSVKAAFETAEAPTDPSVIVDIFDKLIDTPAGQRPMRTIGGLDFGFQAFNDATEALRKQSLAGMGISEWDGPQG